MLSVLIPTYNQNCSFFVQSLKTQADQLNIPYEIIVIDDASCFKYQEKNRIIIEWENCIYLENKHNIGRAAIRNKLADQAQYDWLLFMDCDGKLVSNLFLANYINAIKNNSEVIVGGIIGPKKLPSSSFSLRYKYEKKGEKRFTCNYRNKHPYDNFITFNFFIRKSTFQSVRFNEDFVSYGHEDTFFGKELKDKKINIQHISNPLGRFELESNEIFLEKTKRSIETLIEQKQKLQDFSALAKAYQKLSKIHLEKILYLLVKLSHSSIINHLKKNRNPNLYLFSLYKLYYYHKMNKNL